MQFMWTSCGFNKTAQQAKHPTKQSIDALK